MTPFEHSLTEQERVELKKLRERLMKAGPVTITIGAVTHAPPLQMNGEWLKNALDRICSPWQAR